MKRFWFLLLAIGLLLLSACSDGSTASKTQAVPAPTQAAAPAEAAPQTELAQPVAPSAEECVTLGPQADGNICSATCGAGKIVRVSDESTCAPPLPPATAAPEAWPGTGPNVRLFKELPQDATIVAAFGSAVPIALAEPTPVGEIILAGAYVTLWWVTGGFGSPELGIEYIGPPTNIDSWAAEQAELAQFPAVDWQQWPGAYMGILHPESPELIAGAWMRASNGTLQGNNSQGCEMGMMSSGTICLFAALNDPGTGQAFEGSVAILVGSGPHVAFLVINGQVRPNPPAAGEMGWTRLGQSQYYMQNASMYWKCAWWMGSRLSNGKIPVPEHLRFDAGNSWARWQAVKARYGLVFPIASISLPANPFK